MDGDAVARRAMQVAQIAQLVASHTNYAMEFLLLAITVAFIYQKKKRDTWRDPTWLERGLLWRQLQMWGPERVKDWKEKVGVSRPTFEFIVEPYL